MKVENLRPVTKTITITDIAFGDCFFYQGQINIKIRAEHFYKDIKINAINLEDGTSRCFNDSHVLTPVKAKVVIEG